MTFCVGIKTREGLVALADTQIVRGSEQLTKSKLSVIEHHGGSFFVMTSGLRSVRDKLLVYAQEALEEEAGRCEKLYQAANLFGRELQRIRREDGPALEASGLRFNLHGILGGRLPGDTQPRLFFLYPEGNWIEAADDSPYFLIGRTVYAKPLLDRLVTPDTALREAAALAMLAFDATRTSVTDVGFPVDVLAFDAEGGATRQHRFAEAQLADITVWWHQRLAETLSLVPMHWATPLLGPADAPASSVHPSPGPPSVSIAASDAPPPA